MLDKPIVLIVDDNRDRLFVLRSVIDGLIPHCNVVIAHDAGEGLAIARDKQVSAALIEMDMPEMDGIRMCRELEGAAYNGIQVLLVASSRSAADRLVEGFEAGALDFLVRPFEDTELAARVKRALNLYQREAAMRHYEFMANSIREPVSLLTGEGQYMAVNDAWCAFNGQAREDVLGKSIQELYGEAFYENHIAPREKELRKQKFSRLEIETDLFGKASSSYEVSIYSYHNSDGDLANVVLCTHDITEHKIIESGLNDTTEKLQKLNAELEAQVEKRTREIQKANEALIRSEKRNRSITQTAADAIVSVDENGIIRGWNTAAERIFGYTSDEILNSNVSRIIPDRRMKLYELTLRRLKRGNKEKMTGESVEITAIRKNGQVFPIEFSLSHFKSEGETFYTGIARDISIRKANENELQHYREDLEKLVKERTGELVRFAKAVDSCPVSIIITDRTGNIEYANRKFYEVCGYSKAEVLGQNSRFLKSGVQPSTSYKKLWDTILSGKEWTGEFCNKKKNGEIYWEHASISSIVDRAGNITHFVAVKEDVTERRQAEKRLIEAKEAAEAGTQAKSDFLANMSHEIRTPMNALIGMAHLLMKTELTPVQRNYMEKISGASSTLLGIINNILDFSKIEADRIVLEEIPFRLMPVSEKVLDVFGVKALEQGISLSFDLAQDIPAVLLGDPLRLQQVLSNLVDNALKFTEEGFISVMAELISEEVDRVVLEFTVTDSGVGMTPEESARIFDKFSQADESTTRRFGGTGLGLSICQRLVTLMGGEIDVASTLGEGSVFSFTMPFQLPEGERESLTPAPFVINPPNLRGIRILLAEDNLLNQEVAMGLLEDTHAEVVVADNGREAVELLKEQSFKLLLMDLQMPEMDGLEATRVIREWEQTEERPRTPIIAMTASAMVQDQVRVREAGMDEHIAKPIDPTALYAMLKRFLSPGDLE